MGEAYRLFPANRVHESFPQRLALDCVLTPTLGPGDVSADVTNKDKRLILGMGVLRNMWHRLVKSLQTHGVGRLSQARDAAYLANCPPFGVVVMKRKTALCCQTLMCPFCFGRRYVAAPCSGLMSLLKEKKHPDYKLVGFSSSAILPLAEGGLDLVRPVVDLTRDLETSGLGSVGGFVNHYVRPSVDGPILTRYGVLLCPPDYVRRAGVLRNFAMPMRWTMACTIGDQDRAGMRKVFMAAASYPAWWLTAAPADILVALNAMKDIRRYATHGLPKSRHEAE